MVNAEFTSGVRDGLAANGEPLLGQLLSTEVQGVPVVHFWPHDFPANTIASTKTPPLMTLWRPALSCVTESAFAISGLERKRNGGSARWFAQRWTCRPTDHHGILRALADRELRRTGVMPTPHAVDAQVRAMNQAHHK